jgi:hypothetical protein
MKGLRLVLLAFVVLATSGCPLGPLSGGRLSGDVHTGAVSDWTFLESEETCQLETSPDDPHSVNTWCIGWNGSLYVPTSMIRGALHPSERAWVLNVQSDPEVRVRIDGTVYELVAEEVNDDAVYASVLAALEEKYSADPADREPEREIWLFRMRAR